jgi:AefR-like transcriptional repressor, C-terminal domain/Bacterial regulatory proteins, tetR family
VDAIAAEAGVSKRAVYSHYADKELLARVLGRLPPGSGLAIEDPARAADYLSALTFGHLNSRSLFGLVPLADEERDDLIRGGIDVFLRAYRAP